MDTDNTKKQNGVTKDWFIVFLTAMGFFGVLELANWLDEKYDISSIFNLVAFYTATVKVALASALAWTVQKVVFKNTLGRDFGKAFNDAWDKISTVNKVKWILITFLVIFVSVMFNFS
jgi:hypothetical protein